MTSFFDGDFVEICIPVIIRIQGNNPFDIYIRRGPTAFTKLFNKGEPIDRDRLRAYYVKKGVELLSVKSEDYQQYLLYAEKVAQQSLENPDLVTPAEMTEIVAEMANLTLIEIFKDTNIDPRSVGHATETVKGSIAMLGRDPQALVSILKLMKRYPYLMRHSLSTCLFSILLAKKAGMQSDKSLVAIGLGAFLHDIGMPKLTFDVETAGAELTNQQIKEIRHHPEIGKRLLDTIKGLTPEIRSIVLQHHEQPNGTGYPNGLHDNEIFSPAKIVSICDSFTAMVSDRPYRKAMPPLKALEAMVEDRGKFDKKLLDLFVAIFTPVKM